MCSAREGNTPSSGRAAVWTCLRAVANGSPSVTGIEINPIIADTIMRGRYADYSYHLYSLPQVHIHVTDGRSFVRNSSSQFDVVQMTLVDTWASTAAGAFALSENSLYTVEAFREYFQHLKPDGMVAITRWEFQQPREALRVVSVAMESLHSLGVAEPARNFMVISEGDLDEDGIPVVVLAKKSAFTPDEEQAVQNHLNSNPALVGLYLPSDPGDNPFSALIAANDPAAFARNYPYNVAPVYDNAPFFFFTLKLRQLLNSDSAQEGIDWKVNLGVAVLGMVLIISLLAVLVFLVLPLALRAGTGQRALPLLYFIAVGLGYILVEVAFIQRFVLFLGHPTYALTVVVFLLLLSSGAGSLASRKWMRVAGRAWLPLAVIVAVIGLYVFVLPGLLEALVGLALRRQVGSQRRSSGSSGLRHGHAFSYRPSWPGEQPRAGVSRAPAQRARDQCGGVGVGDECSFQRAGFGAGHGDRHSVRSQCDLGVRRGGLSFGPDLPGDPAYGPPREARPGVCYHAGILVVRYRLRRVLADGVARGEKCLARSNCSGLN